MPSSPVPSENRRSKAFERMTIPIAVCEHARCAWEYQGVTPARTYGEAERHAARTGHSVGFTEGSRV